MTKEEFDNTGWRKGMQVTVKGEPRSRYEVVGVDFEDRTVSFFTDEDYIRLLYDDVELVRE